MNWLGSEVRSSQGQGQGQGHSEWVIAAGGGNRRLSVEVSSSFWTRKAGPKTLL